MRLSFNGQAASRGSTLAARVCSRALLGAVLVLGVSACASGDDDTDVIVVEPTLPPGIFVVRWSIDGLRDGNQCVQAVASDIEIHVLDSVGAEYAAYRQICASFATSITLPVGTWSATTFLVDGAGNRRTTDVSIAPFVIRGNDQIDASVDFPSSSFL